MSKKPKPKAGRSPVPKKTGGAHKSIKDYDRRKWKDTAGDEGAA
jgi:hypothetical protein